MISKDYMSLFEFLGEQYCLPANYILFVDDIADWCRERGIAENDPERPLRLTVEQPDICKILIRDNIPDKAVEQRINALSIRSQQKSVADDKADLLNSERKKLAYLFLFEYAAGLPEIGTDEHLADDWALKEMDRLGFFKS